MAEINLVEAAYLAGTAQNPVSYNAFAEWCIEDPSIYTNRTKTVLSKMLEREKITQEEYDSSIECYKQRCPNQHSFTNHLRLDAETSQNALNYEWFYRPVIDQVRRDLQGSHINTRMKR